MSTVPVTADSISDPRGAGALDANDDGGGSMEFTVNPSTRVQEPAVIFSQAT